MEREIAVGPPLTSLEILWKVTLHLEKYKDITSSSKGQTRTVEEVKLFNKLAEDTTIQPYLTTATQ